MLVGVDLGFGMAPMFRGSGEGMAYVLALDVVQLVAAILCLGLCMRWGEQLPQWVPLLGGSRIHRLLPTVLGALGAIALCVLIASLLAQFIPSWMGLTDAWTPTQGMGPGHRLLVTMAYAPALLWPIALVAGLVGYWRRRSPTL